MHLNHSPSPPHLPFFSRHHFNHHFNHHYNQSPLQSQPKTQLLHPLFTRGKPVEILSPFNSQRISLYLPGCHPLLIHQLHTSSSPRAFISTALLCSALHPDHSQPPLVVLPPARPPTTPHHSSILIAHCERLNPARFAHLLIPSSLPDLARRHRHYCH